VTTMKRAADGFLVEEALGAAERDGILGTMKNEPAGSPDSVRDQAGRTKGNSLRRPGFRRISLPSS
jgi:hypothetical protein